MLAMRLQRTGRSGHAQFRIVVQDSRFSPSKGRVVAYIGSYDPHAKQVALDGEKASQYLQNGAQPSDRVARLLQSEGIKLPDWVKLSQPGQRSTRNPEKRRSTAPAPETPAEAPAAEEPAETPAAEEPAETPAEEAPAEAPAEETPAAEPEAPAAEEAQA